MYIILILLLISLGISSFYYHKSRRTYQRVDKMLDEILNEQPLTCDDLQEGQESALANKAVKIQEKLQYEIGHANQEKEQVKRLISDMSHQLRTPLSSVVMYQELLENKNLSLDDRVNLQSRLNSQTQRLEWILNSLFKMTKLEQGAINFGIEELYIKQTIIDAVNCVYQKAEKKNIDIRMQEFSDYKLLHNRKWTIEVLVNILENAIKYTKPEGFINITVVTMQMYSRIEIKDNGIGIKPEEKLEIFKRFYRSNEVENIEGSGIGLYLSKLILEQEKGYMTVASKYQKGSCFSIYLQNCKNSISV